MVVLLNKTKQDFNRYHSSLHISVLKASWTAQTFLCVIPWAYLHRLHSPGIVFSVIPTLQINSCLLSGAYQVHLYVKYKYLHYKYIQGQTWAVAKARIALCCPDSVSLCPFKCAQPFTKTSLCLMCLTVNGNMCFSLSKKAEANRPKGREEDLRWKKSLVVEGKRVILCDLSVAALVFKAWPSPH